MVLIMKIPKNMEIAMNMCVHHDFIRVYYVTCDEVCFSDNLILSHV
jgi:hypothetical protein